MLKQKFWKPIFEIFKSHAGKCFDKVVLKFSVRKLKTLHDHRNRLKIVWYIMRFIFYNSVWKIPMIRSTFRDFDCFVFGSMLEQQTFEILLNYLQMMRAILLSEKLYAHIENKRHCKISTVEQYTWKSLPFTIQHNKHVYGGVNTWLQKCLT